MAVHNAEPRRYIHKGGTAINQVIKLYSCVMYVSAKKGALQVTRADDREFILHSMNNNYFPLRQYNTQQ